MIYEFNLLNTYGLIHLLYCRVIMTINKKVFEINIKHYVPIKYYNPLPYDVN